MALFFRYGNIKEWQYERGFESLATTYKSILSWFFEFKPHRIFKGDCGMLSFVITLVNVDKLKLFKIEKLFDKIGGGYAW